MSEPIAGRHPELVLTHCRYGVTHVYSQQCGYVLNDAESAKNNMRMMLKVVQASALDAENSNNGRYGTVIM